MRLRTVLLTLPVAALLAQPLWAPQLGAGILGEVAALGSVGAPIAIAAFFGLVALYVLSLRRLLRAVPPPSRARTPASLWLMFAIPFNFVEDFEIVAGIARSLRAEGRIAAARVRRWHRLGIAWCALQLVSLLPGPVGVSGGALALIAWAVHWVLTERLVRVPGAGD